MKKQLPTAVKVVVDQSCVVTADSGRGIIQGGKQIRPDVSDFGGVRFQTAHHIADMARIEF